ncbi:integrase core domain-containing protein [Streptomyces sp. NPDC059832]|uniref:integrase core domain-containing protein n=1 Tax=unclassified Streptomyces TaxID=2593676 RepID=UPI0036534D72
MGAGPGRMVSPWAFSKATRAWAGESKVSAICRRARRLAARTGIEQWVGRYNTERSHSALGYLPPEEFEAQHYRSQATTNAA